MLSVQVSVSKDDAWPHVPKGLEVLEVLLQFLGFRAKYLLL